jgi:adenosylhomocysteinase
MKHGAMVANSGHFDVEINVKELKKMSTKINKNVRNNVDEYVIESKSQKSKVKSIYLLGEGRLINLAAAEGHPASVMDMSFATQALATEHVAKNYKKLEKKVYNVPVELEQWVADLKLKSMGISIDKLTKEQEEYLSAWEVGT